MIQAIQCKCSKTFAACAEPYCYEDADWQKEMRAYIKKGCSVKMMEHGTWTLENCTCPNMKPEESTATQIAMF